MMTRSYICRWMETDLRALYVCADVLYSCLVFDLSFLEKLLKIVL